MHPHLFKPVVCCIVEHWSLFLCLSYCEHYWDKHGSAYILLKSCIHFSFTYMPRSRIVRSHGRSITNFLNIAFHSSWTNLYSHQKCTFPFHHIFASTSYLLPSWRWPFQYLIVKWYFIVVSICNSPMISNTGHFFMCLLATSMSTLEKCLFSSHFLIILFSFLLASWFFKIYFYYKPLSVCSL